MKQLVAKFGSFVISLFCTPYSFALIFAFERAVLYETFVPSIIALSSTKHYTSFFKKGFDFSKTSFQS